MSRIPPTRKTASPPLRLLARLVLPVRLLWRSMKWCARLGLGLLLAAWGLVLVAWLTLHWGILPHIEQWRGPLETQASRALGVPVKLGRIEVRSTGWVPSIELGEVSLLDAQGQPALVLPRVTAAVSPQSLLRFELRFAQLIIDGAHLEVKRDASGRIFIAGLASADADAKRRSGLDWLFKQQEFVVRHGSVRWVDEQRQAPPLLLSDVQLVVRNGLRRHDIRFDATPPEGWGDRLTLRGRFTQPLLARAGQWERWSGQAYADLPQADVRELGLYADLPFELKEGRGALRGWTQWRQGQVESATLDLALREVAARLAPGLEPLQLSRVQGRLLARRSAMELQFDAKQLGFTTQDGLSWPASDVSMKLQQRAGAPVTGGQLSAGAFDLGLLSQIATRLPLGDTVNHLLRDAAPKGRLQDLDLRWQGPANAPAAYQLRGRLQALSLEAKPAPDPHGVGRPGVHNAQLDFEANQAGGSAKVRLDDGRIELPGVFSDPLLPLQRFSADLSWRIEPVKDSPPRLTLQWSRAQFANADMQGEVSGSWRTGDGAGFGKGQRFPGHLLLDGKLSQGDVSQVARYLPQRIPEPVRDYLARALNQGRMSQVTVRVQGDLSDFPFAKARTASEGEFRFAGKVHDATLAYVPSIPARGDSPAWVSPWPAFTELAGEVVIDRDQLEIRNAQARVMGVALSKVNGQVRDLSQKGRTTLQIEGEGRGELSSMLRFVETSPVGRWTGNALGRATASGAGDLKLNLTLPVFDLAASAVKGSVTLLGNDLRLLPELPLLAAARGRVDFSNTGFAIVGGSARLLGGEASFSGGTQLDRSVRITGQGQASAEALQRAAELGPLSRLAGYFNGQTTYRLDLGLVGGHTEVNLASNLVGWSSSLPAPLRKAGDMAWPMRFQTRLLSPTEAPAAAVGDAAAASGKPFQDSVKLDVGSLLQAQYIREWPGDPGQAAPAAPAAPRVLRGAVGVGIAPPALPGSGVAARLVLPAVNLDDWSAVAAKVLGGEGDAAAAWSAPGGYAPTQLQVQAEEVQRSPLRLSGLEAQARWERGEWRVAVNAQQAQGDVLWRPASALQAGRVHARLSHLAIGAPSSPGAEGLSEPTRSVPALDVVVDDFELRGKRLGRLEVQAGHAGGGAARGGPSADWQMQRLALTTPEASLSATGQWLAPGAREARQTQMDFKLQVDDAGALLERLGHAKTVRGGKGELAGRLAWNGSPLSPDPLSMSGQMTVEMGAGQFLKVDPGAARLLGVLSLQALPRRLLLDFRDVFQEGFSFDGLEGDVTIAQGVASTNNLRMRGVQAAVLMEGQASLVDETQDLRVVVVPEINAGTASLAYAVINPALGLGSFLAQMFLRKPLTEANTREFHITGPWADPKVTRVQRSTVGLGAPVDESGAGVGSGPAAAAPAPSSPASGTPGPADPGGKP
jgi:uncharacterized protein (TIGR02099 family)